MMKADGKKTLMYECGYTDDILNSIKEVFDKNYIQCSDFAQQFKGSSIEQTCILIADFVCRNIRYKADPNGQQWIKTPARLIKDGVGDCKSYSILICSILQCLGIDNGFRFAGYTDYQDYTHVYPVAYDSFGNEYIIDCVAIQQNKADLFQEVEYKKKKEIMNSTRISCLSGLGNSSLSEQRIVSFSKNDTIPQITVKCFKYASFADKAMETTANFLTWIVDTYKTKRDLLICAKVFSMYFDGRPGLETMKYYCREFINGQTNPNSPYQITTAQSINPAIEAWFNKNITNYCDKSYYIDVTSTIDKIIEMSVAGLYLFAEDKYLNEKQKVKKENENFLFDRVCDNTGITNGACKLIIYGAIVEKYGMTPTQLLKVLFPKQNFGKSYTAFIGGEVSWNPYDGTMFGSGNSGYKFDENGNIIQSPSGNKTQSKTESKDIWGRLDNCISSISKTILSFIQGIKGSKITDIAPYQGDYNSGLSLTSILPFAVLGIGAYFLIKKSKK